MDTWKFYGITHADHVVCNPTSTERRRLIASWTSRRARGLGSACGKGELLLRLAEQ
jgi:hypothetical protein